MADLPAGFTARPPAPDDAEAVHAVLAAHEEALHDEADVTLTDIRADWARPSFTLATDAIVVEDSTGIVGQYEVFQGRISGAVHPRAANKGLEGWLLDWATDRAQELGAESAEVSAPDLDRTLVKLLESRGFRTRWVTWMFWQSLDDDESDAPPGVYAEPTRPPKLGDGMRVRHPDLQADARALYDLINTAFNDWSDRDEPVSFEDWRSFHLEHDDLEPKTSWVIEDADGELLGAAMSMIDRGWGWLHQLAVRRDERGAGLGTLLLQRCLRSYRDFGLHTAGLMTESRTTARGLYERNGFQVQKSYTRWSLPLE